MELVLSGFLAGTGLVVEAAVENIPADWQAGEREQLEVSEAEASAFLGDAYAPDRIRDGNRRTKWVAPTRPTAAAPQWISLTLAGGPQEVSAVAVFGEAITNDGIVDAEIQVETDGAFRAVAAVTNATSSSWLATFAAVRTSRVRLLVSRSGGPTDHTDVYEIEVFGKPASSAEALALVKGRLGEARARLDDLETRFKATAPGTQDLPVALERALGTLRRELAELQPALDGWNSLDTPARGALTRRSAQSARLAGRLHERALRSSEGELARARSRDQAIQALRGLALGPGLSARQEGGRAILSEDRLVVAVDLATGSWDAAWRRDLPIALHGVRFAVEADGRDLTAGPAESTVVAARDPLGEARELRQVWRAGDVRVERELRVYGDLGVVTVGGRVTNEGDREVRLGTARLLEVPAHGWWWLGRAWEPPAAVHIQGHSLLRATPFDPAAALEAGNERTYQSSGVLELAGRDPQAALLIGYVRADEAAPDLGARFRPAAGGLALHAASRFLGRVLRPRETIQLNRVYLAGGPDALALLEAYGAALARFSAAPVRTGATGLWCSWYAHRMAMTEEKVLANAEVAARHFKPLGLEIMQLDHGWQRGDVTGDWVPNERFPHGLRWLADQLRERHGLRLGLWISPTDVAETSELFQRHPEWLLRGEDDKPRVNWRWYWKPNPNCYVLDATHPGAYRHIVNTFRQLSEWGASYYKIDFIASAGGEHFLQADPASTRGWSALHQAMRAIREGAGEPAWIRYCQTPPVLGAGLANSTIGGDDTLDAGVPGRFDLLRDHALALAAGFWLDDRPYHREVCDMSVRMQAGVEEARVRGAIMALANCSISWSDELCYLPPSRIRLMQQCMPPGNPPMRPLDLFTRDVPSVWHIRATNRVEAWDVVGLFNFNTGPEARAVDFAQLGLPADVACSVFEFWEQRFLGVRRGGVELTLPPQSSRILAIRKLTGAPQIVGTDMHLLQGCHEITRLEWDAAKGVLSGAFHRAAGLEGKAFLYLPEGYSPRFEFPLSPASARLTHLDGPIWMQELTFTAPDLEWTIPFSVPQPPQAKEPTGG